MGDLSETTVTATSNYLYLPLKSKWMEGKSIYSKHILAIEFPLPSCLFCQGVKMIWRNKRVSQLMQNILQFLELL